MPLAANEGARYAILAYSAWGLFPLYWKLLQDVPALTILLHRIFWAFLFFTLYRLIREKTLWKNSVQGIQWPAVLFAASLIGTNWFLYIWAVNAGHIVETSLGYFINPLINVLLGVTFLGERLKAYQKISVALAFLGVVILTFDGGRPPWIALILGVTFSLYGLVRKRVQIGSVEGGQLESLLLLGPALAAVLVFQQPFLPERQMDWIWLVGAGLVTGQPLIWFVEAARRLPYYVMGFFQYLAPTLQFVTGVVIFQEELGPLRFVGFCFIWSGILWMIFHSLRRGSPLRQ